MASPRRARPSLRRRRGRRGRRPAPRQHAADDDRRHRGRPAADARPPRDGGRLAGPEDDAGQVQRWLGYKRWNAPRPWVPRCCTCATPCASSGRSARSATSRGGSPAAATPVPPWVVETGARRQRTVTGYALVEVEVTDPPPGVRLAPDESGVALVSRRKGMVVGFALHDVAAGAALEPSAGGRPARPLGPARRPRRRSGGPRVTVVVCTRDRPDVLAGASTGWRPGAAAGGGARRRQRHGRRRGRSCAPPAWATSTSRARGSTSPATGLCGRPTRRGASPSSTTTSSPTGAGSRACARRWRDHPDAGAMTGQVLPVELVTDSQVAFERRGGFRGGNTPGPLRGARPPRRPRLPVRAGHVRRGLQHGRPPGRGPAPRRLRRGPRHRTAAARRRRHRPVPPRAAGGAPPRVRAPGRRVPPPPPRRRRPAAPVRLVGPLAHGVGDQDLPPRSGGPAQAAAPAAVVVPHHAAAGAEGPTSGTPAPAPSSGAGWAASSGPTAGRRGGRPACAAPEGSPTVAILPWGDLVEDYLDPLDLTLDDYAERLSGGWLFGYAEALRRTGVGTVVVCWSRAVERPDPAHPRAHRRGALVPAAVARRTGRPGAGCADPYAWTHEGRPPTRRIPGGGPAGQSSGPLPDGHAGGPGPGAPRRRAAGRSSARSTRRGASTSASPSAGCSACPCSPRSRAATTPGHPSSDWCAGRRSGGRRGCWSAPRARPSASPAGTGCRPTGSPGCRTPSTPPPSGASPPGRPGPPSGCRPPAPVVVWVGRVDVHPKGIDVLLDAWERVRRRPRHPAADAAAARHRVGGRVAPRAARGPGARRRPLARRVRPRPRRRGHLPVRRRRVRAALAPGGLPRRSRRGHGRRTAGGGRRCARGAGRGRGGSGAGGVVVAREDAAALAGELTRFLADPSLMAAVGEAARRRAESTFSLEAVGAQLRGLLVDR